MSIHVKVYREGRCVGEKDLDRIPWRDEAVALAVEVRVTVRCDRCGVEGRHTRLWPSVMFVVWEDLLKRVLEYLKPEGWDMRKDKHLCPTCAERKRQRDGETKERS